MLVSTPTLERIAKIRKSDAFHWRDRGLLVTGSPRWSALEWEPVEILVAAVLRELQHGGCGNLPGAPWIEMVPAVVRDQWPNYSRHWLVVDRMVVRLFTTAGVERKIRENRKRALVVLDILPLLAEVTVGLRAELRRGNGHGLEPLVMRSPSSAMVIAGHTLGNGQSTQHVAHH